MRLQYSHVLPHLIHRTVRSLSLFDHRGPHSSFGHLTNLQDNEVRQLRQESEAATHYDATRYHLLGGVNMRRVRHCLFGLLI